MLCTSSPAKIIVPPAAYIGDAAVTDPQIVSVLPESISDEFPDISRLLTVPVDAPDNTGSFASSGIYTETAELGMNPHVQFPELFQSLLMAPVQVIVEIIITGLVAMTS